MPDINCFPDEWNIDTTLLSVLGLGLEQTISHLYNNDLSFDAFEQWIMEVNKGKLLQDKINGFNQYILNRENVSRNDAEPGNVFSEADLQHWQEQGYVILRQAIPEADCKAAVGLICDHLEVDPEDAATWYKPHAQRQGIMVQLFQHPLLDKNRIAPRVRAAFEQLWQRTDLWANTDRVGFNPPETMQWKFPGPGLHWDVSLATPIPFGLQGILYLSDTRANQGAFTLVPGFQHRVEQWLATLEPGTDPRAQDLQALGAIPVVANAGDLIIWHQALPHGSSPNHSNVPRYVQYINYAPLDAFIQPAWI